MAAYGCLRSMLTLLDGCTGLKPLLPQLEDIFFPLLQKLLSAEVRECCCFVVDRSIDRLADRSIGRPID
jgi:hypothetical protein